MSDVYDYVIVGGGSSGCVAAALLAEDPDVSVLLLEAGMPAEENPETLRADGYKEAFENDDVIWDRFSEPQPRCGKQELFMGSGTGMGGSGAVNAMVYTRGAKEDYDEWPEGWKWDDLVPHFEAIERKLRPNRHAPTTFTEVCIKAAMEAGFARSDDLNNGQMSGVLGYEWMNFEGGDRRNSYVAFIKEANLPNLEVRTRCVVHRVTLDDSKRVTGVRFSERGVPREVSVRREVILCAGALETPKLMMLSGIGPAAELRKHGIPVVLDAPRVGRDFHDHPNVALFFRGGGLVDFYHPQLYGFHRANPASDLPPTQSDTCYVFYSGNSSLKQMAKRMLPMKIWSGDAYTPGRRDFVRKGVDLAFDRGFVQRFVQNLYGLVVILGKPKSRGTLTLRSDDPEAQALLDPAYFEHPEDMETMLAGVRLARRVAGSKALTEWGNRELLPGRLTKSDRGLRRFIEKNTMTTFHYAGTCRMGGDATSVVDTECRVRGVRGLRVGDASVTPWTPVSAMNAPSMMIGHRAGSFARAEGREARARGAAE